MALLVAWSAFSPACGSGGSGPSATPVVSVPTPTPAPTPSPRQTVVIDAAADFIQYSPVLTRLVAPQAYEFTVRPLRVNLPYPSNFAHTLEVWLAAGTDVVSGSSVGFSASWLGEGRWIVDSYTPSGRWYYGRSRFDLALGESATFRVTKHTANAAEFFVNGISMESVTEGTDVSAWVRARVVGMAAEISWVPTGLASSAVSETDAAPLPCLFCLPRH
jgi:hypothetical protein